MMSRALYFFLAAAALALSGCATADRMPAIGEAYTGPASLTLRQDLSMKSAVLGASKHGERLEILQTRRRFMLVRTPAGTEGWVDGRQLLSTQQMTELRKVSGHAANLPAQAVASAFEPLNVHTGPVRNSPSLTQIPENGKVDVIGHKIAPRAAPLPRPLVDPPKVASSKKKGGKAGKNKKTESYPPPPMPPGPPPPRNWLALSRTVREEPPPAPAPSPILSRAAKAAAERAAEKAAPPMDDWNLIRVKDGKVGWVLSRMLTMSLPDEVAQYAEGHRITSFFPLGEVQMEEGPPKSHYLWTTIAKGIHEYEFDSFRVFIYNARRQRYETTYVERKLKGYYPVRVHEVEINTPKRKAKVPGFSLLVEDEDGQFWRKTFSFENRLARLVSKEAWQRAKKPVADFPFQQFEPMAPSEAPAPPAENVVEKVKKRITRWRKTK